MFSLTQLFGKGDRFVALLESSAEEAHASVRLLGDLLKSPAKSLEDFVISRRKEKKIAETISEELVNTFVTGLEREDIEALSRALYKIPKAVEKFAERFHIASERLRDIDFTPQADLLARATEVVVAMVKQLRRLQDLQKSKELNDRLQYIEGEADKLMVNLLGELYGGKRDPLQALVVKDLYELMEKIIDRCRDAGNVVTLIILKNS